MICQLTVAALRHVLGQPGLLHRMPGSGDDLVVVMLAPLKCVGTERPHRLAVDMDHAGAALCDAASELVPVRPTASRRTQKQLISGSKIDLMLTSIHVQRNHRADALACLRRTFRSNISFSNNARLSCKNDFVRRTSPCAHRQAGLSGQEGIHVPPKTSRSEISSYPSLAYALQSWTHDEVSRRPWTGRVRKGHRVELL